MELSVTPAGDLRLCKARGVSINEVKIGNEPGMQVGQWGEADSVADGVRSNVTLNSVSACVEQKSRCSVPEWMATDYYRATSTVYKTR